jgi:hypothetical protein
MQSIYESRYTRGLRASDLSQAGTQTERVNRTWVGEYEKLRDASTAHARQFQLWPLTEQ